MKVDIPALRAKTLKRSMKRFTEPFQHCATNAFMRSICANSLINKNKLKTNAARPRNGMLPAQMAAAVASTALERRASRHTHAFITGDTLP
ncbi:hypothetical protein LFL96_33475 [Paraburkholderia sp. D15]|uniref:hypothetical protein n=1 Tax=Paraburkholderia sp. D15 TaxID=2880218 RepID=UPI00247AC40F|nr:hypothetical protein [Paraburkholderia sp. D15]WGS53083.1 hypothetical protein LFL96_33475 [Paraburkholderia sp. D15]